MKAQEMERKIQEEQRKIDEDAKNRNIEIERLNGKINDNLSKAGSMAVSGAATSASCYISLLLLDTAGVSVSFGTKVIAYSFFGGIGVAGLAAIPLLLASGYALKKLAT